MSTHLEQLVDILATNFDLDPADLAADTVLADLELDSLVLEELSVIMERRFGVRLAGGELRPELTVGQVAALAAGETVTV